MKTSRLIRLIEINPDIMLGKPVIKGTRLTVELIVEKIAYGCPTEEILKQYPFLKEDDVKAALLYAARTVANEDIYVV